MKYSIEQYVNGEWEYVIVYIDKGYALTLIHDYRRLYDRPFRMRRI